MNPIILGNIISFIGAIIMVAIGLLKKKRQILYVQCLQFIIMGIGNLILGGVTGFISNFISTVRNLLSLRIPFTLPWKLVFIVLQGVLSLLFNEAGLIGWLPFIAACSFTLALDTQNEIVLKSIIIFGQLLWALYDFSIRNYASLAFDLLTIVTTCIGIYWILQKKFSKAT